MPADKISSGLVEYILWTSFYKKAYVKTLHRGEMNQPKWGAEFAKKEYCHNLFNKIKINLGDNKSSAAKSMILIYDGVIMHKIFIHFKEKNYNFSCLLWTNQGTFDIEILQFHCWFFLLLSFTKRIITKNGLVFSYGWYLYGKVDFSSFSLISNRRIE